VDRDRQRRLHVENRLQELNVKYGVLVDQPLPDWLDHYPTPEERARRGDDRDQPAAQPAATVRGLTSPAVPLEPERPRVPERVISDELGEV
jgi:hypothetical protein